MSSCPRTGNLGQEPCPGHFLACSEDPSELYTLSILLCGYGRGMITWKYSDSGTCKKSISTRISYSGQESFLSIDLILIKLIIIFKCQDLVKSAVEAKIKVCRILNRLKMIRRWLRNLNDWTKTKRQSLCVPRKTRRSLSTSMILTVMPQSSADSVWKRSVVWTISSSMSRLSMLNYGCQKQAGTHLLQNQARHYLMTQSFKSKA